MKAHDESKRFWLPVGVVLAVVIGLALVLRERGDSGGYGPGRALPPVERGGGAWPPGTPEKSPGGKASASSASSGSFWLGAPISQHQGSSLAGLMQDLLGSNLDAQSIAAFKLRAHQLPELAATELIQRYSTAPEETRIAILTALGRSGSERIDRLLTEELKQRRGGELHATLVRSFVQRFAGRVLDASLGGTVPPGDGFWKTLLPDFVWLLKSEEDPSIMPVAYEQAIGLTKSIPEIETTLRELAQADPNPDRRSALIQSLPLRYPGDVTLLRTSLVSRAPEVRSASAKRLMQDLAAHRDWTGAAAVFRMIESEAIGAARTGLLNYTMSSLLRTATEVKREDPEFPQLVQTTTAFERTLEYLVAGRADEALFEKKALQVVRELSSRLRGQEPR